MATLAGLLASLVLSPIVVVVAAAAVLGLEGGGAHGAAPTCPPGGGGGGSCPARREEVLLQVQHLHRRSALALNVTDEGSGPGFCCLSESASGGAACPGCLSMASSGTWCGRGRLSCEFFCRGTWCGAGSGSAAPAVMERSEEPPVVVGSKCCLAARDEGNMCGTCWPGSFAQAGSWCARSETNCRSCSGGKGTWCEADADPPLVPSPPPAPPPQSPSPTMAPPSPPRTTTPTPPKMTWTTTAGPSHGAAGCCFAAADPADACGTCYESAFAGPGQWCAESEENCRTCSGSWCAGGAPHAPAPAPPSPTPIEPSPPPAPSPSPPPSPVPPVQPPASSEWIKGTWTTGYWDCCKPSCSWPGKGQVNKPTLACDANTGERLFDANVKSVCDGGTAAACADNAPFLVNEGLSMAFSAVAVSGNHGLKGDENCGQCYELKFVDKIHKPDNWGGSHPDLVGKRMVVQVTNIGYDVNGEHSFDLQIPGAGQGIFTSGCTAQFKGYSSGDFDCDNNYGGCNDKSGCARLPQELQKACEWRYDWYRWLTDAGQTNNPYVDFRRVRCPKELTEISGSVPLDDEAYPAVDFNS